MVSKLLLLMLLLVCVFASFKQIYTVEYFEITAKDVENTATLYEKTQKRYNEVLKTHKKVVSAFEALKAKSDDIEDELQKYSNEPTEIKYTARDLRDRANMNKKITECRQELPKIERETEQVKKEVIEQEVVVRQLKSNIAMYKKENTQMQKSIKLMKNQINEYKSRLIPTLKSEIRKLDRSLQACLKRKNMSSNTNGSGRAQPKTARRR